MAEVSVIIIELFIKLIIILGIITVDVSELLMIVGDF